MIADAPWIRDAEINGVENAPDLKCPVCYSICETLYTNGGRSGVVGCENCISTIDPWDYWEEEMGGND